MVWRDYGKPARANCSLRSPRILTGHLALRGQRTENILRPEVAMTSFTFSTPNNPVHPLKTFAGHQGDIHAVVFSSDDQHIISAGDDKQIIIWNANTGKTVRQWPAHEKAITSLALSPDGKTLASGSRDNSIRLWNFSSGKLRDTLIGHTDNVMSVRYLPTERCWLGQLRPNRAPLERH